MISKSQIQSRATPRRPLPRACMLLSLHPPLAPGAHRRVLGTLDAQIPCLSSLCPDSAPVCMSGRGKKTPPSKTHAECLGIFHWGGLILLLAKAVSTCTNALSEHARPLQAHVAAVARVPGQANRGRTQRTGNRAMCVRGHWEVPVSTKKRKSVPG